MRKRRKRILKRKLLIVNEFDMLTESLAYIFSLKLNDDNKF